MCGKMTSKFWAIITSQISKGKLVMLFYKTTKPSLNFKEKPIKLHLYNRLTIPVASTYLKLAKICTEKTHLTSFLSVFICRDKT